VQDFAAQPFGYREAVGAVLQSAARLRLVCERRVLPLDEVPIPAAA
jgi:hypothetical protein